MAIKSRIMKPMLWASAGAVAAYLCDPERGRSRRVALKDQAAARVRDARRQLDTKVSYVRTTAEGKVEKLRHAEHGQPPNDAALVDKVRSEVLGREPFGGQDILVDACDGVVTLRGELYQSLARKLEKAVRGVSGVTDVENLLHEPGTPAPNKQESLNA